jgi:hypothetical protein
VRPAESLGNAGNWKSLADGLLGPGLLLLTGVTLQSWVFFAAMVAGFFVSSRLDSATAP